MIVDVQADMALGWKTKQSASMGWRGNAYVQRIGQYARVFDNANIGGSQWSRCNMWQC